MGSAGYDRLWNSTFIKLCIIELCFQLGKEMVQPIASNAALALGATVTLAGILAGLSSAIALALRFVSGRIISHFPLNKMLIAAVVVLGVSSLSFAVISSIPVLAVSRVLYGMALVIKSVLNVAICARIVPRESIGQGVAWLGMANVLCCALGPNLAQLIGLNFGYNMAYVFSAVMLGIATVISFTFPALQQDDAMDEEETDAQADEREGEQVVEMESAQQDAGSKMAGQTAPAQNRVLAFVKRFIYFDTIPLAILGLLEGVMFGIVSTLTLTVSEMRGLPEMSLYYVAYVIVSFSMRPIMSKLYDKHGFAKIGRFMCVMMMLAMVSFAFTDNLLMIILDGVLFGLGQGCVWPCLQAESVRNVPVSKTSMSTNTFLLGVDLGVASGPMIGGWILDIAGPMGMYMMGAFAGLCMTLWTFPYTRIMDRREKAQQEALQ